MCGVEVRFPLPTPYRSQIAVMSNVVRAATKGAHALIESPTGSGKSLALLCAGLAWLEAELMGGEGEGEADADANEADAEDERDDASEEASDGSDGLKKRTKRRGRKPKPKVFYCTRTHSQIEQVVKELKRTSYRPQSVVLGSRENYCVNAKVKRSGNVNEECRRMMDESGEGKSGCYYAGQNASKLASLAKSSPVPLDIEDLVDMGKSKKGCPYFASKILAADSNAELIFAPYNYIMDPRTRAAMDIDIEGSLIIFDEAHNIEDVAREAAGGEVALEDVANALDSLDEMRKRITANSDECEMVFQSIKALYSWMLNISDPSKDEYSLEQVPQTTNAWSAMIRGERLMRSINCEHLTQENIASLMRALSTITKYNQDIKESKERFPGGVFVTCEKLLHPIKFLLSNGEHSARDYRITLTKTIEGERPVSTQRAKSSLDRLPNEHIVKIDFRALNPALAFRELTGRRGARSVVLTSGTLSPLSSFASELGVEFPVSMEAEHCVDMDRQVWGRIVAMGPTDKPLKADYKSRGNHVFQDELAASLKEWATVTPHGMLVFFPSYSMMETITRRWKETGAWKAIESQTGKTIFQEPGKMTTNGKKPVTLDNVLKKYYAAVRQSVAAAKHPYAPAPPSVRTRGAIFLAVCRGKVSEGIDFADANARAVICVGIPYPNTKDPLVLQKRSYNDEGRSRGLLSGARWYDQQAFRALNQAVGRCLRHRFDHGAIMLVDERFNRQNISSLPKWLQPAMSKPKSHFGEQLESLRQFFACHAENPPGEDEPASKVNSVEVKSKRKRVSIGASPRKVVRSVPITNFFQKVPSPMKVDYAAPELMDDDFDTADLEQIAQRYEGGIAANVENSPKEPSEEIAIEQIMDGIEWEDEDDEEEWLNQAIQTTQRALSQGNTASKQESTGGKDERSSLSAIKPCAPFVEGVCAKCTKGKIAQFGADPDQRVQLRSRYLDSSRQGDESDFVVVPVRDNVCMGREAENVDFDYDLNVAFRKVYSCDDESLIGFRPVATDASKQNWLSHVLVIG